MKRVLLLLFGVVVAAVGLGAWAWSIVSAPLYTPGEVAARADLDPTDGWTVQPGVTLAPTTRGETGPTVLFVHGGPGAPPQTLSPMLTALAADHRVVTWDQRGSGRSSTVWTGPSGEGTFADVGHLEDQLGIGQQLADIERIRRHLGDDTVVLMGHSYGGLLAALYAAEFPERVEKLVLLAPADLLVFPSSFGGLFEMLDERLEGDDLITYRAWKAEYLDLWGVTERSTEELVALDAQLLPFWEEVMGPPPDGMQAAGPGVWHARAQFFSLGMRHDWRPFLGRVRAPTLVLHARDDLQPLGAAELYAEAVPDAIVETVPGGHFPHYTDAAPLEDRVRRFLR